MRIQVLIATMNQSDHSLLDRMNIQSDAIVVNQCDRDEIERFQYNGHSVLWISANERGIGLSRNTALMRATADIVLFADEDVCYCDAYPEIIERGFLTNPKADILLFDLETNSSRNTVKPITDSHRVRQYNALRYGAVRFACKREALFRHGLSFHLMFGGGARYSNGEDSLFLVNAIKKGLCVWTVDSRIGVIHPGESSWFKGYNEKFFYDRGVLMRTAFGLPAYPLTFLLILKNPGQYKDISLKSALKASVRGLNSK